MSRDLERKLRGDLTRAILEIESLSPAQKNARRTELSQLSTENLSSTLKGARASGGTRGKVAASAAVIEALCTSEEEWLTMSEIAEQARKLGHAIDTNRVHTALQNMNLANGRGLGRHDGYGVEVFRKQRPHLYRLISSAEHELRRGGGAIYLVTIQDKALGEADVALAIVAAPDEEAACRRAGRTLDERAARGGTNCVPRARMLKLDEFYQLGTVARLSQDRYVGVNATAAARVEKIARAIVRKGCP